MALLDDIGNLLGVSKKGENSALLALERQAATQKKLATPANSPSMAGVAAPADPLAQLQQNLQDRLNSLTTDQFMPDANTIRSQALAQASSQYDPLISQLAQQMGQTKQRAGRNEASVKDMYGSLAKDLAAQIPGITDQMRQATDETANRYSQAQGDLSNEYKQQAAAQQNVLQQLGIQAAAPDASGQAQTDQAYFKGEGQLEKNAALNALQQQAQSSADYQQNISDSSRLAGNNAATDIQQQLEDYLQNAQTQLGGLKSQREGALQSLIQQMTGSAQTNAESQRQKEIDNMMALANFNLSAEKARQSNSSAANSDLFKGTSGPAGASAFLAQQLGADRGQASSQIMSLINNVMGNKDVQAGKHVTGKDAYGNDTYTANTDQYLEGLLRNQMSQQGGFDSGDQNAAINALLAYLGKLR